MADLVLDGPFHAFSFTSDNVLYFEMLSEEMHLTRTEPDANFYRFYRMEIVRGLFGDLLILDLTHLTEKGRKPSMPWLLLL